MSTQLPNSKIDFYTSFNYQNINLQHETWKQYANNIYAVQDPSEVLDISGCTTIYNKSVEIKKKKLQKIRDIIAIAQKQSKYFCIINSDIELNDDISIWSAVISKINDNSIMIGNRYDYDDSSCEINKYGFDFFVLNDRFQFDNDKFLMGLCAWDWYIPYLATQQNMSIYNITQKFLLHKKHSLNWDIDLFNLSQEWFYEATKIDRKEEAKRNEFNHAICQVCHNI